MAHHAQKSSGHNEDDSEKEVPERQCRQRRIIREADNSPNVRWNILDPRVVIVEAIFMLAAGLGGVEEGRFLEVLRIRTCCDIVLWYSLR